MEAVQKQRRSVIKKENREAKNRSLGSAVIAKLSDVPTSTRKMRLVADLIRGERVNKALTILKYQPKSGAKKIEKLLLSAIANWQVKNQDAKIEDADLFVKGIFVDGGRMLKRLRTAPQGRAYRVRKRSNHITLVIDSLGTVPVLEQVSAKKESESNKPSASVKSKGAESEKKNAKKSSKNDKE
jgi:large subunit ribosomal protein L22